MEPGEEMNEKQKAGYDQFIALIRENKEELFEDPEEVLKDEKMIMRFLRARAFNGKKTYDMFKKAVKWRREYKPEEITEEEIMDEASYGMCEEWVADKAGRPVVILRSRNHDTKVSKAEDTERHLVFLMEKIIREAPPGIEQFTLLIDIKDIGWRNIDSKLEDRVINILQNYYPERLGKCIMVRGGWFFSLIWTMFKPFFDKRTLSKFVFIRRDIEKGLLEYFDRESIPEELRDGSAPPEETEEMNEEEKKEAEERLAEEMEKEHISGENDEEEEEEEKEEKKE
eukprot:TRINITY_DN2604_c0_g1_i1.p2 TRINITY_DN2604_c0_g1~~TRINITY_DN2604_c0_g1_i1.p2  ORF type:complete len:284 (+),score=116.91 TRINITY_DN2604_c0_g1_i1:120-971(+)